MKGTPTQFLALATPPWLSGIWGTRWRTQLGGKVGELSTWAKDGVKSRLPLDAPPGGLPYMGTERGIERTPGETAAAYRVRLWGAWATWKWAGTTVGVYRALETCGFTVTNWITNPWWTWPDTWPAVGNVWIFPYSAVAGVAPDNDNDPTHWARLWIAIDGHAEGYAVTSQTVGDGSIIGDGHAIGIMSITDPTIADDIERWRRVIRKLKGGHATYPHIFMVLSTGGWNDIIGPFGNLVGSGTTIGATVAKINVGEQ